MTSQDLYDLAWAEFGHYKETHDLGDLDESIACGRDALEPYEASTVDVREQCLEFLGFALQERYEQSSVLEDLDEAISWNRQVLDHRDPDHPDRSTSLDNLADALFLRFEKSGGIRDLNEALKLQQEALELRPLGNSFRSTSFDKLAESVLTRFEHTRVEKDLDDAIYYNRKAVELRPPGHEYCSTSLNNLADAVLARYKQRGNEQDLEEAIECNRAALELRIPGDSYHSKSFNSLAESLLLRFEMTGSMKDLEEAVEHNLRALELRPPGNPGRSNSLSNLANAVTARFRQTGSMDDLNKAIAYHQQALELRPPGHADRSASLANLAGAVLTRYRQIGGVDDLEEGVRYFRQALELTPPGDPNRSTPLVDFGNAVLTRFRRTGRVRDLEEAIECNREAVKMRPIGHPRRCFSLGSLAGALLTRFDEMGVMKDLDDAIECNREALELLSPGDPSRPKYLNNLANAVLMRFEQTAVVQDLDEAIDYNHRALDLCPLGHPDRSICLGNLSSSILTRFQERGNVQDLDFAIQYNQEAVEICPPGHPAHSNYLSTLANALLERFRKRKIIRDLDEAIDYHRKSLELRPVGHPDRGSSLLLLSTALALRKNADLQAVAEILLEAESLYSDSLNPLRARVKSNLAEVYLKQYRLGQGNTQTLDLAFELLDASSSQQTAMLTARFAVASSWAALAREHGHNSVVRAYSSALDLLNQISVTAISLDKQHKFLHSGLWHRQRSLASNAASSAIEAGRLDLAIELLEQGRAILWSRMRGYRHPLTTLREAHFDLAERFESLSHQLELQATSNPIKNPSSDRISIENEERQHRRLSESWDKVVEEIRSIEGFADFLRPTAFSSLRTAAAEGPVIVINVSKHRSDAIIVFQARDPILVPLPDASPAALAALSSHFADPRAATMTSFSESISSVLRTLWRLVVQPIVDELVQAGVPKKSRIWWCPTSHLCSLPIHAAGPYTPGQQSLPDIFFSSYTSTLSALIAARRNITRYLSAPSLVIVAPSDDGLLSVEEEIRRIRQLGDFSTLTGAEANKSTVISHLQQNSWVHFACHGHRNPQPFHSAFQLHKNEPLELLDIMTAQLPNAELAFLSACHGAAVDQKAPDESISLAAALQFCGFRSVVGTLWAMDDRDGPEISEAFYRYMLRDSKCGKADFRDGAKALNQATREMRKRRVPLGRWVNFIHIGA